ncbi:carbon-nitrogen hydrolase family protein [Chryseolinea lacunae]|uniref:Carbon-nitrogen hydrolase family protein n=1 Tax=Chryseolinea lacunae TaxID=2801331 RepID=A0ABS1KMT3_9BACT|nr:carbon-nitrogen hydrolase family protein [Chryseolinea lacunae]MBL0740775.1 carbon-nitrogen hydrolase family protein [Chryseolinea lacunae]
MKICVAQTRSVKGDIAGNIQHHKKYIDHAIAFGADLIIFPELSLTGYEPTVAKALATTPDDSRLDGFQTLSNTGNIVIGVGVPTQNTTAPSISMILFQPKKARQTYSKKYLHADEDPFFVSGPNYTDLSVKDTAVALAICYELSVPEHAEHALKNGAGVYIASVAKSATGVEKASKSLSDIARKYFVPVLMANAVGQSDDFMSTGNSSVWNSRGQLLKQLDDTREGLLVFDTETQNVIEKIL